MWTRRTVLAGAALLPFAAAQAGDNPEGLIAEIEKRAGGRLGVAALDTQNGRRIGYRAEERFAMCSTFKLLLAAAILTRVDREQETLDRWVPYTKADLLPNAPISEANLAKGGMTVAQMTKAIITVSDNTAANLLLASLGGPSGVTQYARSLGDPVTRLDRTETALNSAIAGDPRDTTTPAAMLEDLHKLTRGNALSFVSHIWLLEWLTACKTAAARIPAGLPAGWTSGNKTGTGDNGATNDIAIIWPPGRAPMFLCVYFTESKLGFDAREAVIADVARVVSKSFV